jgi:hypothetical protein
MGSRYGGLKQMDPVGPSGEALLDYSAFDAVRAGYTKVVFVIRREHEALFREVCGDRIAQHVEVAYAFQEPDDLPAGSASSVVPGRSKPWGTAHAVYCARHQVDGPFATVNADDFYGRGAFKALGDFLGTHPSDATGEQRFAMAGFRLANTLSDHGTVARGVCDVGPDGLLRGVTERTRIQRRGDEIQDTDDGDPVTLPADAVVSMNCWGFTPGVFGLISEGFPRFFRDNADRLGTAEYLLPDVVTHAIGSGAATVTVEGVTDRWYGRTYREDRDATQRAIWTMTAEGLYPEPLWESGHE